jgi:hypothetical protein
VTGALSAVEVSLLSAKLQDLERCLEPGLVRLNWNNRGIDAFAASTSKAIQEFQGLHHSVQKNSAIVEKLVSGLAAAKLVADLPEGEERLLFATFWASPRHRHTNNARHDPWTWMLPSKWAAGWAHPVADVLHNAV